MTTNCVIVWTTVSVETDWLALASALVEERLAACVNVLPEMDSIYRWQESVERDAERQIIIKTTAERVPELRARLLGLHSVPSCRSSWCCRSSTAATTTWRGWDSRRSNGRPLRPVSTA